MKFFLINLFFIFSPLICWSQNKKVEIYFPDSTLEKEVSIKYSIHNMLSYFHEPSLNRQSGKNNHFSFTIPDSIPAFSIFMSSELPYQWSSSATIFMKKGEKLAIYLDSIQPARFKGKNADLYNFIYQLKKGRGGERAKRTFNEFIRTPSSISFYDFTNQKITENIAFLDNMLVDERIDSTYYKYAQHQTIDEYLFRAGIIGEFPEEEYYSKIDSVSLYMDLDKLFTKYDTEFDWGISSTSKATYRAMKLISGTKLNLGLDSIYIYCSYLNKEEQEKVAASEIITNTGIGMLNSQQLDQQRNKFKEVFPNSLYNNALEQLKTSSTGKEYMLGYYSKENGFQEYGPFRANDLRNISSMFIGERPLFIDFWATWCGPCLAEFEHGEKLNDFLSKNDIAIIYVSLDYPGGYEKWKQTITEKQLIGFHYLGTPEFSTKSPYFKENNSIPRYILLDKKGAIIIEYGKKPSSGKLIPQIKEALGLE